MSTGGPFHRRPADKRFVKQCTTLLHQPTHWLPMNIQDNECKLMEVRKFSSEYYDLDAKFRRPNLELIACYAVQNPFLYGMFKLRKEQLAMQLTDVPKKVKELNLYFPTNFKNLELISRNNFSAATSFRARTNTRKASNLASEMKFYLTSEGANDAFKGTSNPRLMMVARVTTGVIETIEDEHQNCRPYFNEDSLAIDTYTNSKKTVFHKNNPNEVYPDFVLVYRDISKENDDRSSRINDVIKSCQISYRAGTRFNPDEVMFKGLEERRQRLEELEKAKKKLQMKKDAKAKKKVTIKIEEEVVVTSQPKREETISKGAIPKKKKSRRPSENDEEIKKDSEE